jgi:para-aminobenzoate synthetase/4-amino-4-deoxychorismate lyase
MAAAPSPDPSADLFETLLVVDGRPVELDAHLGRLTASLDLLGAPPPPEDLGELARDRCRGIDLGRLRLTVAREGDRMRAGARAEPVDPELVFPGWEHGRDLRSLRVRGGLGGHKWADRAPLERAAADLGGQELALIVDEDGAALEASRANLFAIADETLLTPRTDGRILPGIARARAIEVATLAGIEVREARLTVADLIACGEVFLTGSVRGVEPARSVDGSPLRPPGDVAATVARGLRDRWLRGVRVLQPS